MQLTWLAALFGLAALVFLSLTIRRLRRRRLLAAGSHGLLGTTFAALAALLGAFSLNLYTYSRLTHERPVAELEFVELAPERYRATLRVLEKGPSRDFELRGNEWQIDARILKWHGVANLLGLDSQFRLDRIAGRYRDVVAEVNGQRTVYALSENPGLDIWALVQEHSGWFPWTDAVYGSATYLPMADGARFQVTLSQTGLVARADNEAAREAIDSW